VPQAATYAVHDVPIVVRSDVPGALRRVEASYAAYRVATPAAGAGWIELHRADEGAEVRDHTGYARRWPDASSATVDVLGRVVQAVLAGLAARGITVVHAGAVVHDGRAAIVAGRSGRGKTTLVLGLVARGLGLLSDELALVGPQGSEILPYRRSAHVRRGTPELVPALGFLHARERPALGGGVEWAVTPAELARVLSGGLAGPAPLAHVLLLDGEPEPRRAPVLTPVPPALAAVELLRGTPSAATDAGRALRRLGRLVEGTACARLGAGALEPTLDAVLDWLETTS
jgi:hypothetical protein